LALFAEEANEVVPHATMSDAGVTRGAVYRAREVLATALQDSVLRERLVVAHVAAGGRVDAVTDTTLLEVVRGQGYRLRLTPHAVERRTSR
jgi:hypothetical protein